MTGRCVCRYVLVFMLGITGCRNETESPVAPPAATRLGQETLDLPSARRAAREVDVLAHLLKMPPDYTRDAEVVIDVDNVEDKLDGLEAEIWADTER